MVNLVEELKSQCFYLIGTCGYVRQGKDCIGISREKGRVIFEAAAFPGCTLPTNQLCLAPPTTAHLTDWSAL